MKRILLLVLAITLLLSFTAKAEITAESSYTWYNGYSLTDVVVTADIDESLAVRGAFTMEQFDFTSGLFDLLLGYKVGAQKVDTLFGEAVSSVVLLGGVRKLPDAFALSMGFDSKLEFEGGYFLQDTLQFSLGYILTNKLLVGYELVDDFVVKGGVSLLSVPDLPKFGIFGLTFGVEASF